MNGDRPFIVDTSTWVLALRKDGSPEAAVWLSTALEAEKVALVPLVKVELLLGARDQAHYPALQEELDALPQLPTADRVYEEASSLAFNLRRKGRTLPLTDVLIAAFAITYSCTLAHHDRHYELIRKALPACRLETLVMPPFE